MIGLSFEAKCWLYWAQPPAFGKKHLLFLPKELLDHLVCTLRCLALTTALDGVCITMCEHYSVQ